MDNKDLQLPKVGDIFRDKLNQTPHGRVYRVKEITSDGRVLTEMLYIHDLDFLNQFFDKIEI